MEIAGIIADFNVATIYNAKRDVNAVKSLNSADVRVSDYKLHKKPSLLSTNLVETVPDQGSR